MNEVKKRVFFGARIKVKAAAEVLFGANNEKVIRYIFSNWREHFLFIS
jgi:hypothetical protein